MFGTSGVRGTLDELGPELALRLAKAFSELLEEGSVVAVGRDVRPHARVIESAVVSGLLSSGIDVEECGVVPTPALLYYVRREGLGGAVAITGSHTPPEIIGVLFFSGDTSELGPREQELVEEAFRRGEYRRVPWSRVGKLAEVERGELLEAYSSGVEELADVKKVSSLGARVVLDLGGGAQCGYLPEVAEALGCSAEVLGGVPDGTFSRRPPCPTPEVLGELSSRVREARADLGLAVDGDGDRALFSDESGRILWGDVAGALLAKYELLRKGGGAVVCPVNTSRLVEWVCEKYGGVVVYTRIGPPSIADGIKKSERVAFAFEETGKYIWPEGILYGDPALALAKVLEVVDAEGALSRAVAEFPEFYRIKTGVECPDELKEECLSLVEEECERAFPGAAIDTADGVKVVLASGDWLLLRPSGTEPVFRCYAESSSEALCRELAERGLEILERALSRIRERRSEAI